MKAYSNWGLFLIFFYFSNYMNINNVSIQNNKQMWSVQGWVFFKLQKMVNIVDTVN